MPSDQEISDAVEIFIHETLGDSWRAETLGGGSIVRRNLPGRVVDPERLFEPPLARLWCNRCKNHWDAWVSDEGLLEDPRDAQCSCGGKVFLTDG